MQETSRDNPNVQTQVFVNKQTSQNTQAEKIEKKLL